MQLCTARFLGAILEDVAHLSPLGCEHVNLLGRYAFALPEEVRRGELRPLRDPVGGGDEAG